MLASYWTQRCLEGGKGWNALLAVLGLTYSSFPPPPFRGRHTLVRRAVLQISPKGGVSGRGSAALQGGREVCER